MNALKKNLIHYYKKLKKIYLYSSDNTSQLSNEDFKAIKKNYYSALNELSEIKIFSDLLSAEKVVSDFIIDGILPNDNLIISELLKRNAPTILTEHLPLFIKYELFKTAYNNISSNKSIFSNTIQSFFLIENTDFKKILSKTNKIDMLLKQDPTDIYQHMNEDTKKEYRNAIYKMSKNNNDYDTALNVLKKSQENNRHIGFFIDFEDSEKKSGTLILIFEALLPLIISILLSVIYSKWYFSLLLYFPLWEALKFISSIIISKIKKPKQLMSMDYSTEIPENKKTLIVVSSIIPDAKNAPNIEEHLKQLYLSNCTENCSICVLVDLKSSKTPTMPEDKANIKAMIRVITKLNLKYNDSFILAVRKRRYSVTENEYTGYERKRGAITDLIKLIKNEQHEFFVIHGNTEKIKNTKYLMALDSDTQMPVGSLKKLVGIAAHPLNKPIISKTNKRVIQGYGIISPKTVTGILQAGKTYFSSIMTGTGGTPAYSSFSSDKYQSLFQKSIFCGKGLIDIDTFYSLLINRLPEQQILSHDIIEGIILRTAFAGNVTLTDSFPTDEKSYFQRQHRWIRGDIQNIPLLFDKRYAKDITPLGRWWLFDNVRRAVTPIISLILIFISLFTDNKSSSIFAIISLMSVFTPDFICFLTTVKTSGISSIFNSYFSHIISYPSTCILRGFMQTIMLCQEARWNFDAIVRSIFRLTVSRKHLLEWTTSADNSNNKNVYYPYFSIIYGIILILFGNSLCKTAGILFALNFPLSILLADNIKDKTKTISENKKNTIISYSRDMWKFYENYCNKKNNFLIPDNIQEFPINTVANRTSPTNIGLLLCAFLAARDFNFISTEKLFKMVSNTLDTIEKLPKYRGNLYNWYNIENLKVIEPYFVSSVDSGNFLCCLVALKEGLKEFTNENKAFQRLINRIEHLIDYCDFGFLYNKNRNLFHIGFDTKKETFSDSYFDLLMSESRMASYFAVAKDIVPLKHWETLDRPTKKLNRYTGTASWSGTMFEYFMPAIFLPNIKNTLESEALNFCIYAQKKRVKKMNIPYGISESCYYSFDADWNYQYKAHGIRHLSLRNYPYDEPVISPYSSFLTLFIDPQSAVKNLKEIENLNATGIYGFYEAIDFTQKRLNNKKYAVVKSFMSHHIGMSFVSSANCIYDNIMQKRFMRDESMESKKSLLFEKISTD